MNDAVVPLAQIDTQRQRLRDRIAMLEEQLGFLDKLADSATGGNGRTEPESTAAEQRAEKPFAKTTGVSDAIREIVASTPGLRAGQVVDLLIKRQIKTNSANPRRSFYSSVATLTRRGHLVKRHGKLYRTEKGTG